MKLQTCLISPTFGANPRVVGSAEGSAPVEHLHYQQKQIELDLGIGEPMQICIH